jgi:hypothetical protein
MDRVGIVLAVLVVAALVGVLVGNLRRRRDFQRDLDRRDFQRDLDRRRRGD